VHIILQHVNSVFFYTEDKPMFDAGAVFCDTQNLVNCAK